MVCYTKLYGEALLETVCKMSGTKVDNMTAPQKLGPVQMIDIMIDS